MEFATALNVRSQDFPCLETEVVVEEVPAVAGEALQGALEAVAEASVALEAVASAEAAPAVAGNFHPV